MRKWGILLAILCILETTSIKYYLARSGQFGFPLDDAWTHQTYARNLGLYGVMAFSPGVPSAGGTSFLWILIIALGYFLKVSFFQWTYLWGGISAVATAFLAALLHQQYFNNFRISAIVATICILDWHLAWAAVSGMEIGLFTCMTLLFFLLLTRNVSSWILGGLTGLIVLVRPEGILLAVLYSFHLLFKQPREIKHNLLRGVLFAATLLIIISPWVVFNLVYAHRPFPNTVTAKFMHYGYPWSLWRSLNYLWNVLFYFLDGYLLLIFPGAIFKLYNSIRTKDPLHPQPLYWFLAMIGVYAVALPFIYDQGRYLMPLIPLVIIYGIEGIGQFLEIALSTSFMRSIGWILLAGAVLILWSAGAATYSRQIRLYDQVHMQAARWLNDHAPQDAIIATHDVGILGYFTNRQIVDLAGLITPEIMPIMHDQEKLAEYLRSNHVNYLVVYSIHYGDLLSQLNARRVFSPNPEQMMVLGADPFEVYEIGR
jgi:hypothetical protein